MPVVSNLVCSPKALYHLLISLFVERALQPGARSSVCYNSVALSFFDALIWTSIRL